MNELTPMDWEYIRSLVESRLKAVRNTIACMGSGGMVQLETSSLVGLLSRINMAMPDPDAGHDPDCPLEHLGPCDHPPVGKGFGS